MQSLARLLGVSIIALSSMLVAVPAAGASRTEPARDVYAFGDAGFFG